MLKRSNIAFAVLGMFLLSVAFVSTASAEQCQQVSPMGQSQSQKSIPVCLVTETSQALVPPFTLQFKVPSEVTSFNGTLVGPGPEEGTNLWNMDIDPSMVRTGSTIQDGVYPVFVDARITWTGPCDPATGAGCGSDSYQTTFGVPIQAPFANNSVTIRRTKKRVTAFYWFDARTPLRAEIEISLNSFKGGTQILARRHFATPLPVGPGPQMLKVTLPSKVINRKCGTKKAPNCSVLASGYSWLGDGPRSSSPGTELVDQGTNARKQLKVHRKPPKKSKHQK